MKISIEKKSICERRACEKEAHQRKASLKGQWRLGRTVEHTAFKNSKSEKRLRGGGEVGIKRGDVGKRLSTGGVRSQTGQFPPLVTTQEDAVWGGGMMRGDCQIEAKRKSYEEIKMPKGLGAKVGVKERSSGKLARMTKQWKGKPGMP